MPDHRSVVEDHRWCDDTVGQVVDDAGDELSESSMEETVNVTIFKPKLST